MKQWLKNQGISIPEFSEKVGISRVYFYEWLRGEYRITLHMAAKIAKETQDQFSLEDLSNIEDERYVGRK